MKMFDAVRLIMTTKLSDRDVASAAGISKTTVGRYRRLAQDKGLTWAQVAELGPQAMQTLFNRPANGGNRRCMPDLPSLDAELQGKGMTLQVWWEDYRREQPHNAPSYSHLAAKLQDFRARQECVMRQHHTPGERVFVDYSGDRPHYIDPTTQQKIPVELFVGVLPASSLMFATCTVSQKVPDFIRAHVAMLDYFGAAPEVIVSDNLKSAVVKTGKSPTIQRSYAELARHYGIAVLPARPYKPRDKATVEASVKIAQQRILARLRHQHFYSMEEVNTCVARLLEEVNARPMQKSGLSRRARFNAMERHALKPLPAMPYIYAEWVAIPKVAKDYHVSVGGHFYSVPYGLIGKKLDARVSDTTVEIMQNLSCVARHTRSLVLGAHTTQSSHQPEAHRFFAERTLDGLTAWAKASGPHLLRFVQQLLGGMQPHLGLPACDALRSLANRHGVVATNDAARRAMLLGHPNITAVKRLLDNASKSPRVKLEAKGAAYYAQMEMQPC